MHARNETKEDKEILEFLNISLMVHFGQGYASVPLKDYICANCADDKGWIPPSDVFRSMRGFCAWCHGEKQTSPILIPCYDFKVFKPTKSEKFWIGKYYGSTTDACKK